MPTRSDPNDSDPRQRKDDDMAKKTVVLRLNQQQLELLDRTIAAGAAADRVALVRRALRAYATKRAQPGTTPGATQ
jgi:Arc/MetJ-type ribon-helix-helix transcriptional regulator